MKRMAITLLLGLCVLSVAGPPAASAQTLIFDYVGFDYESPNPNPGTFGEPGSGYVGVGYVPNLFLPLVADTVNNQYTYHFSGLTPVGSSVIGPYTIINYSPGTLSVYEDPKSTGTYGDFGVNPPNGVSPGTFTDGNLYLQGSLTGFQFVINNSNGTGSFESAFTVTGGSQYGNVFAAGQLNGWTFAGSSSNALNIPAGYEHQIDGQTFLNAPTSSKRTSWGNIKSLYR